MTKTIFIPGFQFGEAACHEARSRKNSSKTWAAIRLELEQANTGRKVIFTCGIGPVSIETLFTPDGECTPTVIDPCARHQDVSFDNGLVEVQIRTLDGTNHILARGSFQKHGLNFSPLEIAIFRINDQAFAEELAEEVIYHAQQPFLEDADDMELFLEWYPEAAKFAYNVNGSPWVPKT